MNAREEKDLVRTYSPNKDIGPSLQVELQCPPVKF